MNIQQYISSGIIEGYLLGLVSEEESAELESMRRLYPQVDIEIQDCLQRMEKLMFDEPVLPPIELKSKILQRVEIAPETKPPASYTVINILPKDENLVTVHKVWVRIFIAAAVILIIALFWSVFYYYKYRKLQQQFQQFPQTIQTAYAKN
ncbi:hypothetical protein PV783_24510 [Chitinophaga sp. CC14]|uniref:hypothetical protein n=1 Tax=Chitinophaga sp. CC14 TaxID=3029199 RepID=UPI003B7A118A